MEEEVVRRSERLSQREAAAAAMEGAPSRPPSKSPASAPSRRGERGGEGGGGGGEASWAAQSPGESLDCFSSRVVAMLREYEDSKKALAKLKEEQRRVREVHAAKTNRAMSGARLAQLKEEIAELETLQARLVKNAGPFLEKFSNEKRFSAMKGLSRRDAPGEAGTSPCVPSSGPPGEEESGQIPAGEQPQSGRSLASEAPANGRSLSSSTPVSGRGLTRAPASGRSLTGSTPASGRSLTSSNASAGTGGSASSAPLGPEQVRGAVDAESSGEESSGASDGGLLTAIKQLESPVDLTTFSFGDEDPGPDGGKKKKKKLKKKAAREVVSFQYVTMSDSSATPRVTPTGQRRPDLEVGQGRRTGGESKSKGKRETGVPAGNSRGPRAAAMAVTPDITSEEEFPSLPPAPKPVKVAQGVGGGAGAKASGRSLEPPCVVDPNGPGTGGPRMGGAAGKKVGGSRKEQGKMPASAPMSVPSPGAAAANKAEGQGSKGGRDKELVSGRTPAVPAVPVTLKPGPNEAGAAGAQGGGSKSGSVGAEGKVGSKGNSTQGVSSAAEAPKPHPGEAPTPKRNVSSTENTPPDSASVNEGECMDEENEGMSAEDAESVVMETEDGNVVQDEEAATGSTAPPAVEVASARSGSYAGAVAAGVGSTVLLDGLGDGDLQRRLLEALKKGEETITVGDRVVDLSFWIGRHGLSAFREKGVETIWSLPTSGQGGARRNVARLRWSSSDTSCPSRDKVVELLLKMGFKAHDIYALIHPYGTSFFDVSFVRPEGLELFWSQYELTQSRPEWRGFVVQAITRQNGVKKVTVMTSNESLSGMDIMTWISRFGEVVQVPKKNLDQHGIWSGAWTFMVKLRVSGNSVTHIPTSTFLGRDRILIFYQGQPKVCHRCGSPSHFSAGCSVVKCALCGGVGHLAATCGDIRCNLCGDLGHPFSRCPRSFTNVLLNPGGLGQEGGTNPAGEGTSRGDGSERPVKSKKLPPSRVKRQEQRRREREREQEVMSLPLTSGSGELAAEVPEAMLNEEVRRLVREEEEEEYAAASLSSSGESLDEGEKEKWLERKKRRKKSNKRVKNKGGSRGLSLERDSLGEPALSQVPTEGSATLPPVDLTNRYHALGASPASSEEEEGGVVPVVADKEAGASGDAGPPALGAGMGPSVEGVDPGPPNKTKRENEAGMDVSVCLKRSISLSDGEHVSGKAGGGKKLAVQLDHP